MATNDFKAFATGVGANVLTQAEYEALTALTTGFSAGTAKSAELNKVWRQSSFAISAIAQFVADYSGSDALDNGDLAGFQAQFETAVALLSAGMDYALDTGAANAYAADFTPAVTTLVDGMVLRFKAANANTGASTFSPNGLGAAPIVSLAGAPLAAGEIVAGGEVWLQYNASIGSWVSLLRVVSDYLNTTRINVASASTVNLTASAPNTRHINITGTTTISGFTVSAGLCYFVRFDGALTLANGAGLVTQAGANIVTQAGDTCLLRATANNVVEVLCYTSTQKLTQASEQVASGTAMDFTGIPAWVQRITVMFDGLSSSGTSRREIRLGTSSGIEATGYLGAMSGAANDTGFLLAGTLASNVSYGTFTLTRMSGNKWSCHGILNTAGTAMDFQSGVKTLSGTLDRLRLTTQNGTDTFDAGTVNIMYEG